MPVDVSAGAINETVTYCTKNPTDPQCAGVPTSSVGRRFSSVISSTTAGSTPGQRVLIEGDGPKTSFPGAATPVIASLGAHWYNTWWGMGLVAVGAFMGYKLIKKPKAKTA